MAVCLNVVAEENFLAFFQENEGFLKAEAARGLTRGPGVLVFVYWLFS